MAAQSRTPSAISGDSGWEGTSVTSARQFDRPALE